MNYYYYPIWHVRKLRSRVCKRYRWSQDLNPEALTGFFTKPEVRRGDGETKQLAKERLGCQI